MFRCAKFVSDFQIWDRDPVPDGWRRPGRECAWKTMARGMTVDVPGRSRRVTDREC